MKQHELERQRYHWFWGLQFYSKPQAGNLIDRIKHWSHDDVNNKYEKQLRIKKIVFPIRFFYWLFNLYQYAEDGYLLSAYFHLHNSEDMEQKMMLITINWFSAHINRLCNYMRGFRKEEPLFHDRLRQDSNKNKPDPIDAQEPDASSSSSESMQTQSQTFFTVKHDVSKRLRVSYSMQIDLRTLGIQSMHNDFITFIEIREAYKKNALLFHPDKNKNTEAGAHFIEIQAAFKRLKKTFDGDILSKDKIVKARHDEFSARYEEAHALFKAYQARDQEEAQERAKRAQEIDKISEEIAEIAKQSEEIAKQIQERAKRIEERAKESAELSAKLKREFDIEWPLPDHQELKETKTVQEILKERAELSAKLKRDFDIDWPLEEEKELYVMKASPDGDAPGSMSKLT